MYHQCGPSLRSARCHACGVRGEKSWAGSCQLRGVALGQGRRMDPSRERLKTHARQRKGVVGWKLVAQDGLE